MNDPFAAPPADEAQGTSGAHDYSDGPPVEQSPFDAPPTPAPAKAPAKKAAGKKAVGEVTVDVKPNLLPFDSDGKVVLTFKGGTGFDAPWIVIHARDLDDAYEQVSGDNAGLLAKIMERSQIAGQHFASLAKPASNGGSAPRAAAPQAAPPAAQEAPGGEKRYCNHGEMRFRSGISKAGKPYQAYFCGSRDRNDECKAQFLR